MFKVLSLFSEDDNSPVSIGIELPLEDTIFKENVHLLDPLLKKAVKGRQSEFVAARACAKKAMESLGLEGLVGFGQDRKPLWPKGVVGSITHSRTLAIACVAPSDLVTSIGIDCELIMTKEKFDSLSRQLATDADLKLFDGQSDDLIATIIFSAKESLYKLINPLCDKFFGFEHASVRSIRKDSFDVELHSELDELKGFNSLYTGHYKVIKNQVVTALILRK